MEDNKIPPENTIDFENAIQELKNSFNLNIDLSKYKDADKIRELANFIKNQTVDIEKRVEFQLKNIFETIEFAAEKGRYSTNVILFDELKSKDIIFDNILQVLLDKGYNAHFKDMTSGTPFLHVSWESKENEK